MGTLSNQLRKRMVDEGFNQKRLSDATGIAKSTLSQYLSGRRHPSEEIARRLASALNCSVEYLNCADEIESESHERSGNVSVAECAKRIGKSQMFVRVALQNGSAPFGFATRNKGRWSYHISPKKLSEYIGTTNLKGEENENLNRKSDF